MLALSVLNFNLDKRNSPKGTHHPHSVLGTTMHKIRIEQADGFLFTASDIFRLNPLVKKPMNMVLGRVEFLRNIKGLFCVFCRLCIGPDIVLLWKMRPAKREAVNMPNIIGLRCYKTVPDSDVNILVVKVVFLLEGVQLKDCGLESIEFAWDLQPITFRRTNHHPKDVLTVKRNGVFSLANNNRMTDLAVISQIQIAVRSVQKLFHLFVFALRWLSYFDHQLARFYLISGPLQ